MRFIPPFALISGALVALSGLATAQPEDTTTPSQQFQYQPPESSDPPQYGPYQDAGNTPYYLRPTDTPDAETPDQYYPGAYGSEPDPAQYAPPQYGYQPPPAGYGQAWPDSATPAPAPTNQVYPGAPGRNEPEMNLYHDSVPLGGYPPLTVNQPRDWQSDPNQYAPNVYDPNAGQPQVQYAYPDNQNGQQYAPVYQDNGQAPDDGQQRSGRRYRDPASN